MSILPPPAFTRLVTIIAHVDHGKTTLADSLVEHNGIISERSAGTVRYLDSMEEEQRRGITIRSSVIALKHRYRPMKKTNNNNNANKKKNQQQQGNNDKNNDTQDKDMVIHIIDSPGHVDFSSEVSSALQICDGALLIVDVVEGMCARTQSVLRESYSQKLIPILVLNKVDRLCTDLGLNINEAYLRIRSLIESVNAAASAMIRSHRAEDNDEKQSKRQHDSTLNDQDDDEQIENIWTFEPGNGNIVFTSAIYGWGFTIPSLARSLFKSKIIPHFKPPIMRQYLFGDFRYHPDTGKLTKWKQQSADEGCTTMFAEYGLKPLWECIHGVSQAANTVGMTSMFFSGSSSINQHHNQQQEQKSSSLNKIHDTKIKASTSGIYNLVLPSLQIGITVSDDAQSSLQTPKTQDEMQSLFNKTNASSEELILRTLLRRHRPLSDAVLDAVCDICPSPSEASFSTRHEALKLKDYCDDISTNDEESKIFHDRKEDFETICNSVKNCDTSNKSSSPVVAHCSKFISTNRAHVNDPELFSMLDSMSSNEDNDNVSRDSVILLGVARVLSGVLHSNDVEYYCFGPKYRPNRQTDSPLHKQSIRLYLLMGSSYIRVESVPAGHICAIHGLEELQLKSVTLCNSPNGMPLQVIDRGIRPLVKVNVEAKSATDTAILEKGLAKLSLADAALEVTATAKGERILACLGEIHLEQSIIDLKNVYCGNKIELRISEPIVEFGESTTWFENEYTDFEQFYNLQIPPLRQTLIPPYCYEDGLSQAHNGRSRVVISNKAVAMHIRVIPLSRCVHSSLLQKSMSEDSHSDFLQIGRALNLSEDDDDLENVFETISSLLLAIDKKGNAMIESTGLAGGSCVKGVVVENGEVYVPSSGVASEEVSGYKEYETLKRRICNTNSCNTDRNDNLEEDDVALKIWSDLQGSAKAGFQAGCSSGPLCEESIRGVLVVLEGVEISLEAKYANSEKSYVQSKPVTGGMTVASLRTGIRCSLLTRPVRLVEGYLRLTLHSTLSGLGPLYAILSRRRGRVMADTMVDGTDLISIDAELPQSESFGLSPELMQKSSGEVTAPELVFSHWDILDEDPFWIPTSLEEREDYGEIVMNGDSSTGVDNNALKYIRMVRDRKGLIVDSNKIIVAAEKQRTLARKK